MFCLWLIPDWPYVGVKMHLNSFMYMLHLENITIILKLLIRTTHFVLFEDADELCIPSTNLSTSHEQSRLLKICSDFPEAGEADNDSDTPCSGQWFLLLC